MLRTSTLRTNRVRNRLGRPSSGRRLPRLRLSHLEDRTVPATITVTNTTDLVAVDGSVSLREAINSINAAAAVNADVVPVGPFGTSDTVVFDKITFGSPQTINMSGEYTLTKSMAINGPGSGLLTVNSTAAAAANSRVFNVSAASTISGLKATGGNSTGNGGGILTSVNLGLTDVTVSGNQSTGDGGGIQVSTSGATLTLTNSSVSNNQGTGAFSNGGGIDLRTGANLTMTDSTVAGNTAGEDGGGVYFFSGGTFTMNRSTISGNQADILSPSYAGGGGVYLFGTTTTITNSTISGNSADGNGGGIGNFASSNLKVFNSTIAFNTATKNGGGIQNNATLTSSIVSNNTDSGVGPDMNGSATATYTVFSNATGVTIVGPGTGNQLGVDPILDVLASTGGPTQTHDLKAGSPAINAGVNPSALTTDQRGFPRTQGAKTDIGSVETPDPAPSATGSAANVTTPGGTSHTVTLVYADFVGSKLIDFSKIGTGDVTVTGPGGFSVVAAIDTIVPGADAQTITATYKFTPPTGSWDNADNGTYQIKVNAGEVFDKDLPTANPVSAGTAGTFLVALPTTYIVNAINDEAIDTDGKTSLREAVLAAEANSGTADDIVFDAVVFAAPQTITLSLGQMKVVDPVNIKGPTSIVTVDAALASRHLDILGATPIAVSLSNMVLTNGTATGNGGSIQAANVSLTMTRVSLTNNVGSAGGALNLGAGSLTATECTFSGNKANSNGGAISNSYATASDVVTISSSTISGNSSTNSGGGILITGAQTVNIVNSTISGNTSSLNGGGLRAYGGFSGTLNVRNTTVVENTLIGAYGVGSGLSRNGGVFNVESTIVAKNSGGSATYGDLSGAQNVNFSIIGATDGATITGANNITGTLASPVDPNLGPLGANGGPTQTHIPLAGSAAFNNGSNPLGLTTDQRGQPRLQGPGVDIGSVESLSVIPSAKLVAQPPIVVPGPTPDTVQVIYADETAINVSSIGITDITILDPASAPLTILSVSVDNPANGTPRTATYKFAVPGAGWDLTDNGTYTVNVNAGEVFDTDGPNAVTAGKIGTFQVAIPIIYIVDEVSDIDDGITTVGKLSLREAVKLGNTDGVPSTINFDATAFGSAKTIAVAAGEMKVEAALTINGPAATLTLNAGGTSRFFNLDVPTTTGNVVSISNLAMTGGAATGSNGGAILNTDEALSLTNVSITKCSTDIEGGAISINGAAGSLTLTNCVISDNSATGSFSNGGGINVASGSNVTVIDSTISGNTAGEDGGGIYFFFGGSLTMTGSTVSNNTGNAITASAGGGGLYLYGTKATIISSTFSGNTAKGTGGAIGNFNASSVTVKNSTIAFNSTVGSGGGVGNAATLVSTIVSNNTATGVGNDANGALAADFSLIGNSTGPTITGSNNVLDVDPLLTPLANYGGPTPTHTLAPGSPALDKGSNPDGLTTDQRGSPRLVGAAVDIGSTEGVYTGPIASLAPVAPIVAPGPTPDTIQVTYVDDVAINVGTIDKNDVTILDPSSAPLTILSASVNNPTNGSPRIATYKFAVPGGAWDKGDNGAYTVSINANQVFDTDGPNAALPGKIGTFNVAIPVTYIVDEATDVDDGITTVGKLTLREAVGLANKDGAASTINFDGAKFPSGTTIGLAAGEMVISSAVVINGPGQANLILDGLTTTRAFNINAVGTGNPVTISGMQIANGSAAGSGGGILNVDEALTLNDVIVRDGSATGNGGGISVSTATGSLTLNKATVSGNKATGAYSNGGGINLDGASTVVVLNSTIANNTAGEDGGGFYFFADGALTVRNSTISGNKANTLSPGVGGGGIYFFGYATTFLIENSTISGNSASIDNGGTYSPYGYGGGILCNAFSGNAVIRNCTIVFNEAGRGGGGIAMTGLNNEIQSSIISGNTQFGANGPLADLFFYAPTVVTGDNNLIGINDPATYATFGPATQQGSIATPLDAKVDPVLALNGAPAGSPLTHALLVGSPAIDQGNNVASLAADERGFARTFDDPGVVNGVGGATDVGAFEAGSKLLAPPTITAVKVNGAATGQHSMVTSVVVTFSEPVNFLWGINSVFVLERVGQPTGGPQSSAPLGIVNINAVQSGTDVTITFVAGGAVPIDLAGSLIDGSYKLTVLASKVYGSGGLLDGDGNGTGGDNFVSPTAPGANSIWRLFGDGDGDGDVDAIDYGQFRGAFGTANPTFDHDGDGDVDAVDYGQFRSRFGTNI